MSFTSYSDGSCVVVSGSGSSSIVMNGGGGSVSILADGKVYINGQLVTDSRSKKKSKLILVAEFEDGTRQDVGSPNNVHITVTGAEHVQFSSTSGNMTADVSDARTVEMDASSGSCTFNSRSGNPTVSIKTSSGGVALGGNVCVGSVKTSSGPIYR